MANYIHSKLANNVDFDIFAPVKGSIAHATKRVSIEGGCGVNDKFRGIVQIGKATEVSDEELAELRKLDTFNRLVDAGMLKISTSHEFNDNGMSKEPDKSAQLTDETHASYAPTTAHLNDGRGTSGKEGASRN